jgi:GMP synthase-like glutamine amidotransferase
MTAPHQTPTHDRLGPGGANVLVLQHLTSEDPGLLGDHLSRAGAIFTVAELDQGEAIPELRHFDALIVMGGPMDVWQESDHPWLAEEKATIKEWVTELGRPYLGVCLGHQLLAAALGGTVGPMYQPEIGVMEISLTESGANDDLLGRLPATMPALQWHGAEVLDPPPGATVLATNEHSAVQAFRVGTQAWGLQFHIEASAPAVAEWATVPEYRATLASTGNGDPTWMHRAVLAHRSEMESACAELSDGFIDVIAAQRAAVPTTR